MYQDVVIVVTHTAHHAMAPLIVNHYTTAQHVIQATIIFCMSLSVKTTVPQVMQVMVQSVSPMILQVLKFLLCTISLERHGQMN